MKFYSQSEAVLDISLSKKIFLSIILIFLYGFFNSVFNIKFPGITAASLRPQIIVVFLSGYFLGPIYGFIVGLVGNCLGDLFLGLGFNYFHDFSLANGIYGLIMGFYPYRKRILSTIKDFSLLITYIILANFGGMAYVLLINSSSSFTKIFELLRLFILPIMLSNSLVTMLLVPVLLLLLKKITLTFSMRVNLLLYYLTIISISITGAVLFSQINIELNDSKILIDMFNSLFIPIIILTIIGLKISGKISNKLSKPIDTIHNYLISFGKDNFREKAISQLAKREDEIGALAKSILNLSLKINEKDRKIMRVVSKNLSIPENTNLTTSDFIKALEKIAREKIQYPKPKITNIEALSMIIHLSEIEDIALSYSNEIINNAFENINISVTQKRNLLLAKDMELISTHDINKYNLLSELDSNFARKLLYKFILLKGENKNFIGYIEDENIFQMLTTAWNYDKFPALKQFFQFPHSFSLISYNTNFDPNFTVVYCHDELKHIKQLIGLLKTQKISAKVQLKPKLAIFPYLSTWKLDDEKIKVIKKIDENTQLVKRKEFDLEFEFNCKEDMESFTIFVNKFSKNNKNQKAVIYDSWFEPLIITYRNIKSLRKAYKLSFTDKAIQYINYSTTPNFNLFKKTNKKISCNTIYVTKGFYDYLGDG